MHIPARFADPVSPLPTLAELSADVVLREGASHADFSKLLNLIEVGALPREPRHPDLQNGESWVHYLALFGGEAQSPEQLTLAERLGALSAIGFDVNAGPRNPLVLAVQAQNTPAVGALIKAGANPNVVDHNSRGLLHLALQAPTETGLLQTLVAHGARLGGADRDGPTPLCDAAIEGRVDAVIILLEAYDNRQLDPRQLRPSPLNLAAKAGQLEVVKVLLARGWPAGGCDEARNTPLHLAARAGHVDIMRALLDAGAATNARDERGDTPLGALARYLTPPHSSLLGARERPEDVASAIALLVGRGANIQGASPYDWKQLERQDDFTKSGSTPLHWAVRHNHAVAISTLLAFGADPSARDTRGRTPRDLARQHPQLLQLFDQS